MMWLFLFVVCFGVLAYQRASLLVWAISYGLLLVFLVSLSSLSSITLTTVSVLVLSIFAFLFLHPLRRYLFTRSLLTFYRSVMPTMSRTEKEALAAGTVSWEGELFKGNPDWNKLLAIPEPTLTLEEQAFLAGPVEAVCRMADDWDITHNRADLPPELWKFIKENGFFGLIIPKAYGGKEFSAYAHSQILTKIYGRSVTVGTTIAVPNSLGPAELLLHYGTDEQKNYYLPRLARGEDIPCFALTSAEAGSDASAMTDIGIVTWGEYEGNRVLGIRLNWNKRYITMAPIATVIGLAFKLHDPDHLLGDKEDIGITCALIPRYVPGIKAGRRHFPLNTPFQHGPVCGENVFIPIEWIIGGPEMAGKGWTMLMECLAAGRAISLPASAIGGGKILAYASGAYARIRKQFNLPIGYFEGIEEVLARIAANTYMMDAARSFAASVIDQGEKPSVASAIVKYHVTELGRQVANDAMDLHGGKTICLGPKNYLGRGYESIPIAITVEGANILTRNLIIFGQGVMRCHPYVLIEYEAARDHNKKAGLKRFDQAVVQHAGFTISNIFRTFLLSLTGSYIATAPQSKAKRYYQYASRFSAAFALIADVSLVILGGNLKRRENISARLGDILSYLYLMSAVLKHYHDQDEPSEDLAIVEWACTTCLFEIQVRFDQIFKNFPRPWVASVLRALIFPWGQNFSKPTDKLGHKIAHLFLSPTESRARLAQGAFLSPVPGNLLSELEDALHKVIAAEPIEKMVRGAKQEGIIQGYSLAETLTSAIEHKVITEEQRDILMLAEHARQKMIAVDDFAPDELARVPRE